LQKVQENVAPEASSKKINAGETPKDWMRRALPHMALGAEPGNSPNRAFALASLNTSFIVRFLSRVASLQPVLIWY
jgi:hypothetical protein